MSIDSLNMVNRAEERGELIRQQVQGQLATKMVKSATQSALAQVEAVAESVAQTRALMDAEQGRGTQVNTVA
ncbi:hypothetical protein C882_4493 [Caenispirillum salinarum AK4]|uniref:Uncharacterized protein n=1 Tax=Caenispirillum salinarum AK4 TaxID=1238182 RepID=K9H0G2_9PROT|nr:hypothetical protein [Caenispirillum salinarum]EKV30534.1 hypothetical protein C882_4493 [Caenispirillum salinarum AK4]